MNNINIYPISESDKNEYLDVVPTRYAYSINYLVPLIFENGSIKVQLINYEPERWKTWFPFYSTTNDHHEFETLSKGLIYKELNNYLESIHSRNYYLNKAQNEFRERFSCGNIDTTEIMESYTQSEVKFSKTFNEWTIYKTDFVILKNLENYDSLINNNDVELLDLNYFMIDKSCMFKGLPIVDNYCSLLRDTSIQQVMKQYAMHVNY